MKKQEMLDKVSEETMIFMRGKYALDEVGNGKDELKFRRSGKTILTIYLKEDGFDFLVIFGKKEREKFEEARDSFSDDIRKIYDESKTYHDGKWMRIPVADLDTLEEVKRLVLFKKKPNRKPFPEDQKIVSKCGHRCDLCIHFTGGTISGQFREELKERLGRVWGPDHWGEEMMLCPGCFETPDEDVCDCLQCAGKKKLDNCLVCQEYPCRMAPVASSRIEVRSLSYEDITWGILPYVAGQYGN